MYMFYFFAKESASYMFLFSRKNMLLMSTHNLWGFFLRNNKNINFVEMSILEGHVDLTIYFYVDKK